MPTAPKTKLSESELKQAVYVRRLVCYDVEKNNKKGWSGYCFSDGTFVAEFGMVGVTNNQTEPEHCGSLAAAKCLCDKKAEKKLKYTGDKAPYQELRVIEGSAAARIENGKNAPSIFKTNLAKIAVEQIDTNTEEVKELIRFLASSNRHRILANTTMTYDESAGTFRTPLGIVTLDAIQDARRLLNDIGAYVVKKDYENRTFIHAVNNYLMTVPQNVGTKLDVRNIFPDTSSLQKQNGLLDSLEASVQSVMAGPAPKVSTKQVEEKVFSVKLHRKDDGATMDRFRKLYQSTRKDMHVCAHLNVKAVYEVEIASENEAFAKDGAKVGGIVEAWHGSSHANILSILSGGLRVPPANASYVTGSMFGAGCYGALASTKSLNYSYGYWDGSRNDRCFMFRMDMSMGKFYTPTNTGGYRPAGYDSIWAKAGRSGVANDELIVPRASMVKLKWLLEFTPNGR